MDDPHVSRSMDEIIEPEYDPLGGRPSPDWFLQEFRDGDDWRWPPDHGKVPGSESWIEPAEAPPLDRIGGGGGSYLADDGASLGDRAVPPDRMTFERGSWRVDADHGDLTDGTVRLERSEVAYWFGQEGGGSQYRFIDERGRALSRDELVARGIIREVP